MKTNMKKLSWENKDSSGNKSVLFLYVGISILAVALIFLSLYSFEQKSIIGENEQRMEKLTTQLDSLNGEFFNFRDSLYQNMRHRKNYVKNRFAVHNSKIQDSTVQKFIEVAKYFNLDVTDELFDICIAQICYESGAKQFYHNGIIVKSSGHALGISQIVPTTAFQYMKHVITCEERIEMEKLGCDNFDWIDEEHYSRKKKGDRKIYYLGKKTRRLVKEWLYSETNNLVLWGYIMNEILEKRNYNIDLSLMVYNRGPGYAVNYLKSGKKIHNHKYVKTVNKMAKMSVTS